MRRLLLLGCVLLGACQPAPPDASGAERSPASVDTVTPRCVRAGGRCVGPAAIAARPEAPCPAGMHRVDDVSLVDPGPKHPACYGMPLGEEACCIDDP